MAPFRMCDLRSVLERDAVSITIVFLRLVIGAMYLTMPTLVSKAPTKKVSAPVSAPAGAVDVTLSNGLRFVGERIEGRHGVAMSLRIPAGSKDDPADKLGLANLVTETLTKGTRSHSARKLSDAYDYYGIKHGEQTGIESTSLSMRFLPEHQSKALGLLREILSEPTFPAKECETARIQSIQELKHLDDEPMSKAFVHLKEMYFGSSWGHTELGNEASIPNITQKDIVNFWKKRFIPAGTIVSAAGKFDPDALIKELETLFSNSGLARALDEPPAPPSANVSKHIKKDSEQTQIVMAYPSVPRNHPLYYAAQAGVGVLSGGMSGRLFTEVREKRALVYSVGAQSSSLRGAGVCYAYAGTTAKRAAETLSVLKAELKRMPTDVTEEEVERAKIGFKSHLIMDQESTGARARELLDDVYFHNRIIPVAEVIQRIDAVKAADVRAFGASHPIEPCTLVTLGRDALE